METGAMVFVKSFNTRSYVMLKRWILLVLIGLGLVAGMAIAGNDENISLSQVPAKAREALLKLAKGAQITEVEREKEHGMIFYEAEWKVNGREKEAKVTAEGALVELEEKIRPKNVPAAVKKVVAKEFPAGAKVKYERVMIVVYEVEGKVNGKEKEILILPTGKIHGREEGDDDNDDDDDDGEENEVDVTLDQVPAAVKATILAEAKGVSIKEIERESKKGKAVYEAEWMEDGKEIEIKVSSDGKLLKREIEEEDDDDDK
jgi:uncharacterized membrane protein YkoI